MPAYAVAIVRETSCNHEIRQYLERIDQTLEPFSGVFRIHGGPYQQLEGCWSGDLVVIEFPDLEQARMWYQSDRYQKIRDFRVRNTLGEVFLVDGVPKNHKATDIL